MASFDVFVHPGELETFGQALQEAMASGVPVIAPAKGGPIDIVAPSRTGWLYPPGRLDLMRARAIDLLGDDAKRRAFGVAARAATRASSWDAVCGDLVHHYEAAIATHRPVTATAV
jgi:phosphatidylinositol alpha 1,6-mannosyltransferase